MTQQISATLALQDGQVRCRRCGHGLGAPEAGWKGAAALKETPLREVGGEPYAGGGAEVVVRQFACPGCGALLDTETALKGDPFLEDVIAF